jgi:hypothetical protein
VPPDAGLQKRATFSTLHIGLDGTGNRTLATCVASSGTNRSAIHYALSGRGRENESLCMLGERFGLEKRVREKKCFSMLGCHSPIVSTILLRFFYDFFYDYSPRHFPAFQREILVSRSKENPSLNLARTKFFYNSSTKSLWNL